MTLFADVGRALCGADFIAVLSRELEIDKRTVQRWASGEMFPPQAIWDELARRLGDLQDAIRKMGRRADVSHDRHARRTP